MKPLSLSTRLTGCALILSLAAHAPAQAASHAQFHEAHIAHEHISNSWIFSLVTDGYLIPNDISYVNPNLTADHRWLHLEARYNSEYLHTGSVWFGYNFTVGKKLVLNATPIAGAVFGRTTGVAPGLEASLTYKKLQLSTSHEYVFNLNDHSTSYYDSWPQFTYSPVHWLQLGLVGDLTVAYPTTLDTQRGVFAGISHKNATFTTYVFNSGESTPAVLLELTLNH